MFAYDNTQGYSDDEIEMMNEKLIFRCAQRGISPIASANRDNVKDMYAEICVNILEGMP